LIFYLPAAFAAFVYLPTDKLTMIVGRVAMVMGILAVLVYGAGLFMQWKNEASAVKPGVETLCGIVFGGLGGGVLRMIFGGLLGVRRGEYKKNAVDEKSF